LAVGNGAEDAICRDLQGECPSEELTQVLDCSFHSSQRSEPVGAVIIQKQLLQIFVCCFLGYRPNQASAPNLGHAPFEERLSVFAASGVRTFPIGFAPKVVLEPPDPTAPPYGTANPRSLRTASSGRQHPRRIGWLGDGRAPRPR